MRFLSKFDTSLISYFAAWKDYFLLHVERLGSKVYPQAYAKISASSTSSASGSRYDFHACAQLVFVLRDKLTSILDQRPLPAEVGVHHEATSSSYFQLTLLPQVPNRGCATRALPQASGRREALL